MKLCVAFVIILGNEKMRINEGMCSGIMKGRKPFSKFADSSDIASFYNEFTFVGWTKNNVLYHCVRNAQTFHENFSFV